MEQAKREEMVREIQDALTNGDAQTARKLMLQSCGLFSRENPAPNGLLVRMIRDLHDERRWDESVPLMEQLLHQAPTPQPTVQLKLAQILYRAGAAPSRTLELLSTLPDRLSPEQQRLRTQLTHLAKKANVPSV